MGSLILGTRDKRIRNPKTNEDYEYKPKCWNKKPKTNEDYEYIPKSWDKKYKPKGELTELGKARIEMMKEMTKHHENLKEIVNCSNATPFDGITYRGYVCFYCDSAFLDPTVLKKHTLAQHTFHYIPRKIKNGFNRLDEYFMRLDITDLRCALCDTNLDTLEDLIKHLESDHKKALHNVKNQLVPFKFDNDVLKCCICPNTFEHFRILQSHMNKHYRNFVCDTCDAGFVTRGSLRTHLARHEATGVFKCNLCPKTFETKAKASRHETVVHIYKNLVTKCGYCNEKFTRSSKRDDHVMKVHGIQMKKEYKCNACDKTYSSKYAVRIHTRRDHLMERRFKCTECEKAFFQAADLKFHMVTHTKARDFQCTVCLKMFTRKETLRQHMEIHSDTRRFKCERCDHAFVQKISWKGHMKSKHGVIVA